MAELPARAQAEKFDLAAFSARLDPAIDGPVADLEAAIPVCGNNLRSSNADVRRMTLIALSLIEPKLDASMLSPIIPQIDAALTRDHGGTEKTMAATILANLGPKAPDSSVAAMRQVALDARAEESLRAGAAGSLLVMRPGDREATSFVVSLIDDPKMPRSLRIRIISVVGKPRATQPIEEALEEIVNHSSDKELRDAAIAAAKQIGASAVTQVEDTLSRILADPAETAESRHNAKVALMIIQPGSEDIYSP